MFYWLASSLVSATLNTAKGPFGLVFARAVASPALLGHQSGPQQQTALAEVELPALGCV